MIYLNKKLITQDLTFVLCDFDHTITKKSSSTSWSFFSNSSYVPAAFLDDSDSLFQKYRPIEMNHNIKEHEKNEQLAKWANEQISLFAKYNITASLYHKIIIEDNNICLRTDFVNFVYNMYHLDIPIYIVSAGLIEPIIDILSKENCLLPNVKIYSNSIDVKENQIIGLKKPIIYSFNKDLITLPISIDRKGLLFGDLPSDKNLAKNLQTIDVGFVNEGCLELFQKQFDIALTDNSSFDQVGKILFKSYQKRS